MGMSPASCGNTLADPSTPAELQQTLSSRFQEQPLILATAWGPRLIHRLTPLPRTQISKTALRASPPSSWHRVHHCNLHASSRPQAPMDPPHLDSNTDHPHIPQHLQTTSTTTQAARLQMRRLQEGHDAKTPPSHVRMDKFSPKSPRDGTECLDMIPPAWSPTHQRRRHHAHRPVKAFTRLHHTCRPLMVKEEASSSPPLQNHQMEEPGIA
jgi:hypothetical protein